MSNAGPRRLGRYHLLRRIAQGGMGEIYLAATRGAAGFEKHVAIKRILPHLAADPEFVARFIDEARIVVTLTHGNIVPVLDMGQDDGEYFIAMEYLAGKDLRAVLTQASALGERFPASLAVYVTAEVCRGLGYAHRKLDEQGRELRIIHRDVSPSNVLLSWEGMVKMTDFGVASAVGRMADSMAGSLRGKLSYMSPEQASGERLDRRSDVYSCGICCWEMLTGERLFEGATDTEVLRKVQAGDVPLPSTVVEGLPDAVDGVVMTALALRPSERYACMEDFEADLQQLLITEYRGTSGAPALADRLRSWFPEESGVTPVLPSLDDALADGLLDLDAVGDRGPATVSGRLGIAPDAPDARLRDSVSPAHAETLYATASAASTLRWVLPLALLGLAGGYLAGRPMAVPSGRLEVRSSPTGAEVRIGSVAVGVTPWIGDSLPVDEQVEVRVSRPRHTPFRRMVRLRAGTRQVLYADLQPTSEEVKEKEPTSPTVTAAAVPLLSAGARPPWERRPVRGGAVSAVPVPARAPASASAPVPAAGSRTAPAPRRRRATRSGGSKPAVTGTLFLRVKPTGLIRVGGKRYSSPLTGLKLPVGVHTVVVENPEWGVTKRVKVRVEEGKETREVVELVAPETP